MKFITLKDETPSGQPNHESVLMAANEFWKSGALGIKDAFSKGLIQELQTAIIHESGLTEDERGAGWEKIGDKRYQSAVRISTPFNTPELYANPAILAIISAFFGKIFKIDSIGAVCSYPGAELQHIHRDHLGLFQSDNINSQLPPYAITVFIPLVDLDIEAGPTAVWEGTHRASDVLNLLRRLKTHPDLSDACIPHTVMGDCYLYDFRLVHSGMPNQSLRPRPALSITYARPWFHDHNSYNGLPHIVIDKTQYEKIPEKYKSLFVDAVPAP